MLPDRRPDYEQLRQPDSQQQLPDSQPEAMLQSFQAPSQANAEEASPEEPAPGMPLVEERSCAPRAIQYQFLYKTSEHALICHIKVVD